jgi:hypothetical protein
MMDSVSPLFLVWIRARVVRYSLWRVGAPREGILIRGGGGGGGGRLVSRDEGANIGWIARMNGRREGAALVVRLLAMRLSWMSIRLALCVMFDSLAAKGSGVVAGVDAVAVVAAGVALAGCWTGAWLGGRLDSAFCPQHKEKDLESLSFLLLIPLLF